MNKINLSYPSQAFMKKKAVIETQAQSSSETSVKSKKHKVFVSLVALGALGAAGVAIYKNKKVQNFVKPAVKEVNSVDEKFKKAYNNAIMDNSENITSEEFKILKEVYAAKYEKLPDLDGHHCIDEHHNVSGYNQQIRNAIKNGEKSKITSKLDCAFSELSPLKEDITVYRGRASSFAKSLNTDFDIIEKAKIGDIVIPDTAYSYTAFHRSLAENWSCGFESNNMMYEIRIPKGARVSRNLEHGGEVLMPRGAQYKLISKGKDPDGVLNVIMEYILP